MNVIDYTYDGKFIKFKLNKEDMIFKGIVVMNFIDNPIHIDIFNGGDPTSKIAYVHLSKDGIVANLTSSDFQTYTNMLSYAMKVRDKVMEEYNNQEGL